MPMKMTIWQQSTIDATLVTDQMHREKGGNNAGAPRVFSDSSGVTLYKKEHA